MSKTVINKHIATSAGGGYTSSDLQYGEIGINYQAEQEAIYIKNSDNEVARIGTGIGMHYPGSTSGEVFNNYSGNRASGEYSHAEGGYTTASGSCSHAEGYSTSAIGLYSHAEGGYTRANGYYSHAGGISSSANGIASFSQGEYLLSQNEGEAALGVRNTSVYTSMLEGDLTARATLFSVGMGVDGTARNAMELKYNGDLYLYGAGNYNGRNSLGNAAYDSTVQTVQSLLGGGSSIASGSKVLICNASKTETGKTVTDSSVNVEDGTMVTVMFINGHSGKSTGEYISLSVNGIKGNIVSSKKMDSSSYTYMPPFISPNSVLSLVYYNKLWYLVGNPIIAHSYCYDSSFYYFYNIWGNRLMMYTIHQVSNNTSLGIITFKFPIIFNNGNSLAAVAAGNSASTYLTGRITNLKKDSLGIQFTDENYSNKGNGCIIVAGLI